MRFVSLHGHTSFSFGDGHGSPAAHVERAKQLGMSAIAVTEHGNVSSHVQLEKACKDAGIKPIFGVEAYVAPPQTKAKFHQTILAMTQQGYRQLSRLVTMSYDEGMYHKPTIHPEWLLDSKLTSDLVVLSGCADSWLSCTIAGGKGTDYERIDKAEQVELLTEEDKATRYAEAFRLVENYLDCYGDRFYLEVQRFKNYARTRLINQQICLLSDDLGVPLVGTADVHYPLPEDWSTQLALNSIAWKVPEEELSAKRDYSADPCTFPLSDKEFAKDLIAAGVPKDKAIQATKNTAKVAERLNVVLPKTPDVRFSGSDGTDETAQRMLVDHIKKGLRRRAENSRFKKDYIGRKQEYLDRIKKELAVIKPKGFSDYFLINEQIIGWAKAQGIAVGPARGSAAGSLVCFLLGLTEINPMLYPEMLFERFLDPGREDPPDIDTDYENERRHEVFEYARTQYGDANVGNIRNFTRYKGKTAVKDVGRSRNIPLPKVERYASLIGEPPFGDPREFNSAEDAATSFKECADILNEYPDLERAFRIEGDMKTFSVHAAGMVISNLPIHETCAVYKTKKTSGEEADAIAFDKRDAGYLNMLKLDCLGLITMSTIADVIKMTPGLTLQDMYDLEFNDPKVLKAFADDDLTGIFQFEGRSTRGIVRDIYTGRDVVPTFMQLADINALSRPGSLSSGMTGRYIKVARGEDRKSLHPVVDKILEKTNGCLVYQEQVMHIGKQFGGLSDHEIGLLRKIIGAKKAGGAFDEFWAKFKEGSARLHGASEKLAREIWDYMAASSSYLFNASHAISYAAVAYWCMWLKVYHPAAFYAASLRSAAKKNKKKDSVDPQLPIMQDAVAHGVTVSPPIPGISRASWWINEEGSGVVAGYTQIPGIGPRVAEGIIALESVTSWSDCLPVRGFGPKALDKAEAFCASGDPFGISLSVSVISAVRDAIVDGRVALPHPTTDPALMTGQNGQIETYIGHIVAIKLVDVIQDTCTRENKTREQVVAEMERPELSTKAKIITMASNGVEVHVNVSRYNYPRLRQEFEGLDLSKPHVVHTTGKVSTDFGPAVQASQVTVFEMEEEK